MGFPQRFLNLVQWLAALFFIVFPLATQAKGPLDIEVAEFSKTVVTPILVKNGLCNSRQECREKEYFFCVSWETVSCDVYGITDETVIKEILTAAIGSKTRFHSINFWGLHHSKKSLLDKPIVSYINKMAGK